MDQVQLIASLFDTDRKPRDEPSGGGGPPPAKGGNWWDVPASLVGPPAVDPAIHGIDPSDFHVDAGGSGGLTGYAGGSGLAGKAKQTKIDAAEHAAPSTDVAAMFGSPVQAGTAPTSDAGLKTDINDNLMAGDRARASALNDQLQIAAIDLEDAANQIFEGVRVTKLPVNDLLKLVASAQEIKRRLTFVSQNAYKHPALKQGYLQVLLAGNHFRHAMKEFEVYAKHDSNKPDPDSTSWLDRDEALVGEMIGQRGAHAYEAKKIDLGARDSLKRSSLQDAIEGIEGGVGALEAANGLDSAEAAQATIKRASETLQSCAAIVQHNLGDGGVPTRGDVALAQKLLAMIQRIRDEAVSRTLDKPVADATSRAVSALKDVVQKGKKR